LISGFGGGGAGGGALGSGFCPSDAGAPILGASVPVGLPGGCGSRLGGAVGLAGSLAAGDALAGSRPRSDAVPNDLATGAFSTGFSAAGAGLPGAVLADLAGG